MKKIFLLFLVLFLVGCGLKKVKEPKLETEPEPETLVFKVYASPHAPEMVSKRIGVLPFSGDNKNINSYVSRAVADSLVSSGLHIIEPKHLISELKSLLDKEKNFEEANEWEEFKKVFKNEDREMLLENLFKLKEMNLVDFLLIGDVIYKERMFFLKNNKITETNLEVVDIQNGAVIYSVNYMEEGKGGKLTPRELSERLANALIAAMR